MKTYRLRKDGRKELIRRWACRRCQRVMTIIGRGLCSRCFQKHRNEYEPLGKVCQSGLEFYGVAKPCRPTEVSSGPDKVEVLCARASAGEELFHKEDAKGCCDGGRGKAQQRLAPTEIGYDLPVTYHSTIDVEE